jgi:hypothetical protein
MLREGQKVTLVLCNIDKKKRLHMCLGGSMFAIQDLKPLKID